MMHSTREEVRHAGWDFIDSATAEMHSLYQEPVGEDQAQAQVDARDEAADTWMQDYESAMSWHEHQEELGKEAHDEYERLGKDHYDQQQAQWSEQWAKQWEQTKADYERQNAPQQNGVEQADQSLDQPMSYNDMLDQGSAPKYKPSLKPKAGELGKVGEAKEGEQKRPGISYEAAANNASSREKAMDARQDMFADQANDMSRSTTDREKSQWHSAIEKQEFDAGRMHDIADRMSPASESLPWRDKYEAQANARDAKLVEMKEAYNERFGENMPVVDSQGNARSPQECRGTAQAYEARFEMNHTMGRHSDLERHREEFRDEMQSANMPEPVKAQDNSLQLEQGQTQKLEAIQPAQLEQAQASGKENSTEQENDMRGKAESNAAKHMEAQRERQLEQGQGQHQPVSRIAQERSQQYRDRQQEHSQEREQSQTKANESHRGRDEEHAR